MPRCPVGTYSNASGASAVSSCRKCPAGTYQPIEAAATAALCVPCAVGNFSAELGAARCHRCPAGGWVAACRVRFGCCSAARHVWRQLGGRISVVFRGCEGRECLVSDGFSYTVCHDCPEGTWTAREGPEGVETGGHPCFWLF